MVMSRGIFVKNNHFTKVHIEGAEPIALKAAARTPEKGKPILLWSI
jgi:hypothetical protein